MTYLTFDFGMKSDMATKNGGTEILENKRSESPFNATATLTTNIKPLLPVKRCKDLNKHKPSIQLESSSGVRARNSECKNPPPPPR